MIVEFRIVKDSRMEDYDEFLLSIDMDFVPNNSEVINIKGNPYYVHERSWSVSEKSEIYCYIRILETENTIYAKRNV